jgi:hypothetical protein
MLSSVAQLSNHELLARVKHLAQREREATAALIAHLAELDARRLYLAEGCSSLFTYCTQVLHLSEHAAYGRIEAARAVRRFPIILERLGEGAVTLTTVGLLAAHLTSENHRDLLAMARHKSKRQVEELVARLRPQPPVPTSVRKLPTVSHASASASATAPQGVASNPRQTGDTQSVASPPLPSAALAPPPPRQGVVAPLAPERYKVQFTASADTYAKLRLAQALLRHQIPDGELGKIIDRALTALVQELARKKFAATDHPRGGRGTAPGSRHIPAEVTRAVWLRDGGRCAFVSHEGRRCTERGFLEFHHVAPTARVANPRRTTSSSGAAPTMATRPSGTSGGAPPRVCGRHGRPPCPRPSRRPRRLGWISAATRSGPSTDPGRSAAPDLLGRAAQPPAGSDGRRS